MTIEAEIILQELKLAIIAAHSPWVDNKGAAAYCGRSTKTIGRAADAGKIKKYRTDDDGKVSFKKKELDAWMEGKK